MLILGLLGIYFDAAVVFFTKSSLFFRLAVAILCKQKNSCSKLWLIDPTVYKTGVSTRSFTDERFLWPSCILGLAEQCLSQIPLHSYKPFNLSPVQDFFQQKNNLSHHNNPMHKAVTFRHLSFTKQKILHKNIRNHLPISFL